MVGVDRSFIYFINLDMVAERMDRRRFSNIT